MPHKLAERTYLSADGKVAKEGSPEAAVLLGVKGDEIPEEQAQQLGLLKSAKAPAANQPAATEGK